MFFLKLLHVLLILYTTYLKGFFSSGCQYSIFKISSLQHANMHSRNSYSDINNDNFYDPNLLLELQVHT